MAKNEFFLNMFTQVLNLATHKMATFDRYALKTYWLQKMEKYELERQFLIQVIDNTVKRMVCTCEEEWREWDRLHNGRNMWSEPPLCALCRHECGHPAVSDLKKIEQKIQRYTQYLEELARL